MSSTSSASVPNRRSFLARSAAVAAVPGASPPWPGAPSPSRRWPVPLPDYAPIPKSALGPAVNAQGYYVGRVEKNLYWVTDSTYQAAFLTTRDGVVLFDAPPTIGHNLQRAIDEVASANGVPGKVTHIVYSHHHADHLGASSLFGRNVTRSARLTPGGCWPRRTTRPGPCRHHLRHPLHAARRRGADRPGLARH